jgi:cell division septation protein DedD
MGSNMPSRQDEEFELVLGNKQLLSLFFVVVVLFAIFFSFGYTVGFSRGQQERVVAIASTETAEPEVTDVRIPDTLLEAAPKATPDPPPLTATPKLEPNGEVKAPPRPTPKEQAATPPQKKATPAKTAAPTGAQIARGIHVQVAALRVRSDAQLLVNQLRAKRYPAALYDQGGDGWHRVVVGPFTDVGRAKAAQTKMRVDGLQTILRKP